MELKDHHMVKQIIDIYIQFNYYSGEPTVTLHM